MEKYSREEIVSALLRVKEKYPAVFRWFFLWEIDQEAANDSVRHKTTSGEAGRID